MKKYLVVLSAAVIGLSLAACGNNGGQESTPAASAPAPTAPAPAASTKMAAPAASTGKKAPAASTSKPASTPPHK